MPNCPVCGTPEAYIGLSAIECKNKDCRHYKKSEKTEEKHNPCATVCGYCHAEGHSKEDCPYQGGCGSCSCPPDQSGSCCPSPDPQDPNYADPNFP